MVSLDRMRKELNLTPQQSKEMEEVLGDFVMYFQTLTEQMKELRGSARARIMQILDEEQRRKCLRLLGEMQSKSPR